MQLALTLKSWGGRRRGAGRKPKGIRAGVSHQSRPEHRATYPVHVTMRVREDVANLRTRGVFLAVKKALQRGAERFGFRLIEFSVLRNHLHMIVEADNQTALRRGMQGLGVRIAKAVNRVTRRTGSVFNDRYHSRALKTPREVRSALAYVLLNHRRHQVQAGRRPKPAIDPCSSAAAFDGWRGVRPSEPIVARARSWLLRIGWRRRGLLSLGMVPG